jgi:predicted Zn-dependent peptidase
LQTPESVAARVAQFLAVSGDLTGIDKLYAAYAAITPADVHAAAQRYLEPARRTVGVLRAQK